MSMIICDRCEGHFDMDLQDIVFDGDEAFCERCQIAREAESEWQAGQHADYQREERKLERGGY